MTFPCRPTSPASRRATASRGAARGGGAGGVSPAGGTVAVSREAGSRGASIGRRVARQLGWQVYDQELLEYVAQDGPLHQELIDGLPPAAAAWLGQRLEQLL